MPKPKKNKTARTRSVATSRSKSASQGKKRGSNTGPAKPQAVKMPVEPAQVRLVAGKGSAQRGGGPGGHYWHIYLGEKRAGYVYINVIDEPPFGKHASIQIHINQGFRGRGIGRVAYRLACEQSHHDVVIAHMRKSNVASQRAAAAAGFKFVNEPAISQIAMQWTRISPSKHV